MIFDNAPDESCSFLRAYWPNGRSGAVLVTTRNACLAREFSIPADFALGPIDEKSSVKILLRGLPEPSTPEEQKAARQICFRLGNLPLALSQMSGYIHESGCSLDSFLITYQDFENLPVLHKTSQPGSTTGYEHTIATVWAMTMSLLETRSVTALRTLSLLAFLDPDGLYLSFRLVDSSADTP
jgi:hypothetical protein